MDLYGTLKELHAERERILELIHAIEEVAGYYTPAAREKPARRRGRKSMGAAEREQVSERMKKYWALRRAEQEREDLAATG